MPCRSTPGFDQLHQAAFSFPPPSLELARAVLDGQVHPVPVRLRLSMANRHGLLAGANGTGKTKTLQLMVERFSRAGVPVFVADIKGDLAGLCRPGSLTPGEHERAQSLELDWQPSAPPAQLWSLTSFGPLLLSRVLELNDTQSSVLSLVFKLCDDEGLLLLDLPDRRAVLDRPAARAGEGTRRRRTAADASAAAHALYGRSLRPLGSAAAASAAARAVRPDAPRAEHHPHPAPVEPRAQRQPVRRLPRIERRQAAAEGAGARRVRPAEAPLKRRRAALEAAPKHSGGSSGAGTPPDRDPDRIQRGPADFRFHT